MHNTRGTTAMAPLHSGLFAGYPLGHPAFRVAMPIILGLLLGTQSLAMAAPASLSKGMQFYNKGLVQQAIGQFQQAIKTQPSNAEAYAWLGRAYKKQGGPANIKKAKNAFRQAIKRNPNDAASMAELAELLSWEPSGRNEAIGLYRTAVRLAPSQKGYKKALSENLTWAAEYEEALPLAKAAYPSYSKDANWLKTYAFLLTQTGNETEAVSLYEGSVLKAKSSKDLYTRQGYTIALSKTGRSNEAHAMYESIKGDLKASPTDAAALKRLKTDQLLALSGLAYELGNYEEALAYDLALPQAIQQQPANKIRIARSYGKLCRFPEAVDTFYSLYQANQLSAAEKVEFADMLTASKLPNGTLPQPGLKERLYKEALPEASNKTELALRLAQLFSQEPGRYQDTVNFYTYVLEQQQADPMLAQQMAEEATAAQQEGDPCYPNQPRSGYVPVDQQLANYLLSQGAPSQEVYTTFENLLQKFPDSASLLSAYAEVQSWDKANPTRREQAITLYLKLLQTDPANRSLYLGKLEQVLEWHTPRLELLPLYAQVKEANPDSLWADWAAARAYWLDSDQYGEALSRFQALYAANSSNEKLFREYVNVLVSAPASERGEALKELKALYESHPGDMDVTLAYAKVLSYAGKHDKAVKYFDEVLASQPENQEAVGGKALSLLWGGKRYGSVEMLRQAHAADPNNRELTLALAQAEKAIGRNDNAIELIKELKQQGYEANFDELRQPEPKPVSQDSLMPPSSEPPSYQQPPVVPRLPLSQNPEDTLTPERVAQTDLLDFDSAAQSLELLPEAVVSATRTLDAKSTPKWPTPPPSSEQVLDDLVSSPPVEASLDSIVAAGDSKTSKIQSELDLLDKSLETLKVLQERSKADVDLLEKQVNYVEQVTPAKLGGAQTLQEPSMASMQGSSGHMRRLMAPPSSDDTGSVAIPGYPSYGATGSEMMAGSVGSSHDSLGHGSYEGASTRSILQSGAATQDTYGQALTVQDEFRQQGFFIRPESTYQDELSGLEQEIDISLRPTFNTGFLYSTQDGDDTTYGLKNWVFPNQLSVALTPQVRMRAGYALRRFYNDDVGLDPRSTYGNQYAVGLTAQPTDRLTLDGDFAITQFTQSETSNITYQANARYVFTDWLAARIGMRRSPFVYSLQAWSGLTPNAGPLAGQLVGQVRENAVFAEANLGPWKNFDWNLAYEFAWIDGNNVPDNTKNQAYSSLGYNWKYLPNHRARLSHEFLFFGFAKQATNGFYDLTGTSGLTNVASSLPVTLAAPGTVRGGYFSPDTFFLNAARLELRGNFFDRHLEYRLGGSLGVQNYDAGLAGESDPTVLASAFDVLLIYNINDTFSIYGLTDYLDAGGLLNRWRFGGGVQVRPNIRGLSPIFGGI